MKLNICIGTILAACALQAAAKDAHWLWYPGDFEIYVAQEVQETRLEWGGVTPVMWPQYHHYPVVRFCKTVELAQDETMTVEIDGKGMYVISGVGQGGIIGEKMTFKLAKGRHDLSFKLVNSKRLPSLRATAQSFVSDSSWTVEHSNCGTFVPAACNGYLCDSSRKPSDFKLATEPAKPVSVKSNGKGGIIADFGKETYGFPVFEQITGRGRVRVIYGESEKEALADGLFDDKLVIKPNAADVWEYLDFEATDRLQLPVTRAFRYVNVVPVEGDVKVGNLSMVREYNADLKVRGAFECDDAKLNEIWRVCEYTLQLTAREFLLDGIKRDRWVWSGDAKQSALLSYYVYGEREVVRRTLWALRGKDPVWRHINTISDYTFYWFGMAWEYYLYTGDREFLREIYPSMKTLMEFVESRMEKKDDGWYVSKPGDWTFVDWAPSALENYQGPVAVLQILLARAYEALAAAAEVQGDAETAKSAAAKSVALRKRIVPTFWNDEKGGLVHALGKDGKQLDQFTRYANMFGIFYGYFDDAQTKSVIDHCLLNDQVMKIVTPYMRFYELEAHCAIGRQAEVTKEMRAYWGGMLDLGATSFWELFDPREKGDQHYAMYGRTFGRSFCHAWGASPAYLLGRYYLGVTPTRPGFAAYEVCPNLGGLKWMHGKVPTPNGEIEVTVKDGKATVRGCAAGFGTLRWKGRKATIPPGATVTLASSDKPRLDRSQLLVGTYYLHAQARDEAHVKAMKEAGIDFVFGIDAKDRPALDLLRKHNLRCIATGVFPGWGGGDGSRAGQLEKLHPMDEYVKAAKGFEDHPAIWMVDIGDEPSAWDFPYYARLIPEIRRHLPKAVTPYLNLYPNYAQVAKNTDAQQKSQLGTATYAEHIAQYSAKIPLDYLSYDFYVYSARPKWQDVFYLKNFDNFKTVADACRASGRSFWFIPQVNSLFPGVHMTPNRLRYQAYLAMAFGAEVINWACWMKGWWTNNVVNPDGTVNEYEYQILKTVNRELHALGPDYMRFRNMATHFVGFPPSVDLKSIGIASVEQLTAGGISDLKAKEGGELVVGEMSARDGSSAKALFVVSANDWRDAGVPERALVFRSAKPVRVIRPSGATEVRPNANGVCELVIASSEAVLLVL